MDYLRNKDYNKIIKEGTDSLEYLLYIFICKEERIRNKLYSDDEIMAKVNKKFEELTKEMDEVFLDKEAYYEELSYEMGENEGRKEEKIEIAKNLLKDNLDIKLISKYTSLSIEEIESLKK